MESAEQYIRTTCYRGADQWSIYFLNKNGLSLDEVDKIISPFVKKKRINQTSNETCFINLLSLEDAHKCVKGLQGHKLIQLKKQVRDRGQSRKNDGVNKSDVEENGMYNNEFKEDKYDKEDSVNSNHVDDIKNTPNQSNELITDLPMEEVININTNGYSSEEFQEEKSVEVEPKMPELILKKNPKSSFNDTTVESQYLEDEKFPFIETLEAEELIIANIDENYGTNYILHLLEKYQPICASFVQVSERYLLRYCHVYFTSTQYINEIKTKFDNFKLGLNNLMVFYVNRSKDNPILE